MKLFLGRSGIGAAALLCVALAGCHHQPKVPPLPPQTQTPNIYIPLPPQPNLPPMEAPPPADEARPLGQRLGTFGVFLLALLAGAVAWLACSLILPR